MNGHQQAGVSALNRIDDQLLQVIPVAPMACQGRLLTALVGVVEAPSKPLRQGEISFNSTNNLPRPAAAAATAGAQWGNSSVLRRLCLSVPPVASSLSVGHLRGFEHGNKPEATQHEGCSDSRSDSDPCHQQWNDQRKSNRPCERGDCNKPTQGGWRFGFGGVQNHSARASLAGLLLSSGV